MATLKALVNSQWVPLLGSGQAAADTARWNSAWGIVAQARVTVSQSGITTVTDLTGASVTFTAAEGRRYKITGSVLYTVSAGGTSAGLSIRKGASTQIQAVVSSLLATNDIETLVATVDDVPGAGSVTYKLSLYRQAGTGTVATLNDATRPDAILVEDVGPVTPASVAPPTAGPRVVASGNALGIVAMGSNLALVTASPSTATDVTNPLTFTPSVGRRYRLVYTSRAIGATATTCSFSIIVDGVTQQNPFVWVSGNYTNANFQYVFNGDGVPHTYKVATATNHSASVNIYGDQGCLFFIEDVGPNASPALPIPETPPAWTPFSFATGWSNLGSGYLSCGYRKIGDVVDLRGVAYNSAGTGTTTIGVLPVGFRPPSRVMMMGASSVATATEVARLDVWPDGTIISYKAVAAGLYASLDGIRFSTTA